MLAGRWEGQKKKNDHSDSDYSWPGGLEWTLHMVDGLPEHRKYTMKPQPNVGAQSYKYYRQLSVQLADGVKGLLHINLVNGITSFGTFSCSSL